MMKLLKIQKLTNEQLNKISELKQQYPRKTIDEIIMNIRLNNEIDQIKKKEIIKLLTTYKFETKNTSTLNKVLRSIEINISSKKTSTPQNNPSSNTQNNSSSNTQSNPSSNTQSNPSSNSSKKYRNALLSSSQQKPEQQPQPQKKLNFPEERKKYRREIWKLLNKIIFNSDNGISDIPEDDIQFKLFKILHEGLSHIEDTQIDNAFIQLQKKKIKKKAHVN